MRSARVRSELVLIWRSQGGPHLQVMFERDLKEIRMKSHR